MAIESLSTDRSPTPEGLLRELSHRGSSGVLEIEHPGGEVSRVWVRGGGIYAMQVPGYRPALGIRLLSGGLVSPEQLSAAAAEQRERFPTHLIGQVLVTMGYVPPEVIEAFVHEQVLDQVADLLDLDVQSAAFHPGRRIQHDIIAPTPVEDLLAVAMQRRAHRADVLTAVGGAHVVPQLGPPGQGAAQTPLGPYDWALLCRVDGRRDITELARVCGFTVQEAAQMVADLALTGLLVLPERADPGEEPLAEVVALRPGVTPASVPAPDWQFDGTDAGEPEPVGDLLAELSAFVHEEPLAAGGPAPLPMAVAPSGLPADPVAVPSDPTIVADDPADPTIVAAAPAIEVVQVPAPTEPPASPAEPEQRAPEPAAASPDPIGSSTEPVGDIAGDSPAEESAVPAQEGYSDTREFMRELSSLSDDPEQPPPVVTRLVVPLTEQRTKRRFWSR
jgi:hypothetical protein